MKKQRAINLIAQIFMFSINLGISFFLVPYITERIGIEAYGFVGLANDFVGYAQIITIALNSMAARFITIKIHEKNIKEANKYFSSVVITNIILSVFLSIVGIIFVTYMQYFINIPNKLLIDVKLLFILMFVNFVVSIITSTFSIATFCTNKLYLSSIKTIISQFIRAIILLILFCLFKPSVFFIGVASLVCTTYIGFCNYRFTKSLTPELKISKENFNFKYIKSLISSGIWNTFSKLSSILSNGLDLLISNVFIGSISMGIISCTKTIANLVLNAFGSITVVFAPELTISYAKKDYESMKNQLLSSIKLLGIFSAIPMSILFAYGNNFYSIWMPSQNSELLYFLSIAGTIGLTISLPLEPLWNIFTVTNKVKSSSLYLFFNSLATIIITITLLLIFKNSDYRMFIIVGVSTVFTVIRSLSFLPIYGAKYINLPKTTFYPPILKNLFVILLTTILSFGIKKIIIINSWISLIICSLITAILTIIISIYVILSKSEKAKLINNIKVRLKYIIRIVFKDYYNYMNKKNKKFIDEIINSTLVNDKTILFESEGDFTDNCRSLYEYMIKEKINNNYKIIWIVDDPLLYKKEKNVEFISRKLKTKKDIVNFYSHVASAKYLFFTHPYWYTKSNKEQIIINLWHGIPLKAGGRDLHNTFDYLTIPSEFSKDLFKKFVGVIDSQCIVAGSPRNDLLFLKTNSINKIINIKKNPKIIICMTTFKQSTYMKDSSVIFPYVLPFVCNDKELSEINDYLVSLNIKLIIKIHHLQKTDLLNKLNLSNIIYLEDNDLNSKNIQLYELIGQTDALITDYSSIMFDYMLINKPIGYFINDIEEYKKTRGFLVDDVNEYMIGEKMKTKEEFYNFLSKIKDEKDDYKKKRKEFCHKMNKYTNDNCKRILDIFNIK